MAGITAGATDSPSLRVVARGSIPAQPYIGPSLTPPPPLAITRSSRLSHVQPRVYPCTQQAAGVEAATPAADAACAHLRGAAAPASSRVLQGSNCKLSVRQ